MCLVDFLSPVSRQIVIFFVDWRDNLSQHEPSKPSNPEQRHTAEVWENAVTIPPASTEHGKPQALGSGKARDGREWGLKRERQTTEAAMGISKRTPREAIGTVLVLRLVIIAQLAAHEVDHA